VIFFVNPQSYFSLAEYDFNLLKNLNLNKEKVRYFCSINLPDRITFSNEIIVCKIFNYSKAKNSLFKLLSYLYSLFLITLDINKDRPEIIHLQWLKFPPIDYFFLIFCKIFFNVRIVLTAHNFPSKKLHKFFFFFEKKSFLYADKLIVHNHEAFNKIRNDKKFMSKEIFIQPHGLFKFDETNEPISEDISEFFKVKRNSLVMTFIGSGGYFKGLDILIDAWKKINNDKKNINLVIAGRLNLDKSLIQVLENETTLIIDKELNDNEVCYLYNMTDIVILPYREVSQSGVLMASFGHQKLVICSNHREFIDAVSLSNSGWIFDGSIEGLLEVIIRIAKEDNLVPKMRKKYDFEILKEKYSWKKAGKVVSNIYKSLKDNEKANQY